MKGRASAQDGDAADGGLPRGSSGFYARAVSLLRLPIVLSWAAVAVYMFVSIPGLPPASARGGLTGIVGSEVPAVEARLSALHHFAFPLLSQVVVVQYSPSGLSRKVQIDVAKSAAELNVGRLGDTGIAGAIPISNIGGFFPSSSERGTAALTFLFFRPTVGFSTQVARGRAYAEHYLDAKGAHLVGLTGAAPALEAQGNQISKSLKFVELAALALVAITVGLAFRSVLAPVITLLTAGVAYVIAVRLLSLASAHVGISVPGELSPIIVVLLLGVVTDYCVFFLSGFRDQLRAGQARRVGHIRSVAAVAPIVLAAGLTVSASLAVVLTAHLKAFSSLGPGLALTVFVSVLVAVTFIPAILALLGRATFWPSHPWPAPPAKANRQQRGVRVSGQLKHIFRQRLESFTVRKPVALSVVVLATGLLGAGAWLLHGATIGVNLVSILPSTTTPSRASRAASMGFAPGIVAPTEVLLSKKGITEDLSQLRQLQTLIANQPGVAGVVGPADKLTRVELGAFLSSGHDSARYLVIFDHDPFDTGAISELHHLERSMPALEVRAGIGRAKGAYAGDTAISAGIVDRSVSDLLHVGLYTMAVDLVILIVFLRSVRASIALLCASGLVVAAAMGVTSFVFTQLLGTVGFTFYVPFAAEVLLISFGTDYNMYLVGSIWEWARRLPFPRAVVQASADASFAINVAGITLACSFAMLALVTLGSFHQLAMVMFVGLAIDTLFVRPFVVPAALSLWAPKRFRDRGPMSAGRHSH